MKRFVQDDPSLPGEILHEFYFEPLNPGIAEAAEKLLITGPNTVLHSPAAHPGDSPGGAAGIAVGYLAIVWQSQ